VVSKSFKVTILLWLMRKKLDGWQDGGILWFCLKIAAATGAAWIAGWAVGYFFMFNHAILKLVVISAVFMSTFIGACQLLKISELKEIMFLVLKKKNECNN